MPIRVVGIALFLVVATGCAELSDIVRTRVTMNSCTGSACSSSTEVPATQAAAPKPPCIVPIPPGFLCLNSRSLMEAVYVARTSTTDPALALAQRRPKYQMLDEFARRDYLATHQTELTSLLVTAKSQQGCTAGTVTFKEYDFNRKAFNVEVGSYIIHGSTPGATGIGVELVPQLQGAKLPMEEARARNFVTSFRDNNREFDVRFCGAIVGTENKTVKLGSRWAFQDSLCSGFDCSPTPVPVDLIRLKVASMTAFTADGSELGALLADPPKAH